MLVCTEGAVIFTAPIVMNGEENNIQHRPEFPASDDHDQTKCVDSEVPFM